MAEWLISMLWTDGVVVLPIEVIRPAGELSHPKFAST